MKPNFMNSVKMSRPGRNNFDLTHDVKLSGKMGQLIPILNLPCIPGDKIHIHGSALMRLTPMLAPMMHRCDVTMHYFFVPNRILWDNWEKFITNNNGSTDPLPAFPTVQLAEYFKLLDYMGLPTPPDDIVEAEIVSALPLAAYQMIYDEYYRDQNLQTVTTDPLVDGDNTTNTRLYELRNRAWEHDYFTSCLPFEQKGPSVDIPIGGFDDVGVFRKAGVGISATDVQGIPQDINVQTSTPNGVPGIPDGALFAETSTLAAGTATINDLRTATKLQEWYEKFARAGSRYVETIKGFFGIDAGDARLQRPEFITGIKSPITISEVLNTTGTEEAPQGNMAGHGISVVGGKHSSYFCREHGYVIGILSVLPKTAYQQGIDRDWTKFDPLDFYWPEFAHLGEQAVSNREVYAFTGSGDLPFGYNPKYSEYKTIMNRVAGDFRTTLDFWHMGRIFSALPGLNSDFVTADPTTRVFAVEGTPEEPVDQLLIQVVNGLKVSRLMPKFGTPSF